jgi:uncharacterized protein YjiS (DUF1127 family)
MRSCIIKTAFQEFVMKDYALHQAQFSESLPGHGILTRLLHNWQAKRSVTKLHLLDDHMLRDIGLTRADVEWAANQPLTINASLALEEISNKRWHGIR